MQTAQNEFIHQFNGSIHRKMLLPFLYCKNTSVYLKEMKANKSHNV